jgi:dipeptidyl aminopeptidase/acylaminoacyl peptidase
VLSRRRPASIVGAALAVALLALLLRLGPALTLALTVALPGAERWLSPLLADVTVEETTVDTPDGPLHADLYRSPAPRGALLLVHGLSRAGRRHPELVRLARVLARHRRLVMVPQFEGLAVFRLSGREVAEARAATRALAGHGVPVGVVGFSFGAGPALLAAADTPDVALAVSFGGYADLEDVVVYLTTGVHAFDGRRHVQPPEPYNRWKLLALLVGFVQDTRDRRRLDELAARRLADPGADGGALEAALGPEGRAVLALVQARDPDAVAARLAALPAGARTAMRRLSPLAVVPRLNGHLVLAHGAHDVSIPFTESLRLARASSGPTTTVILESFEHTRPRPFWQSLAAGSRDAIRLVRLADALLVGR